MNTLTTKIKFVSDYQDFDGNVVNNTAEMSILDMLENGTPIDDNGCEMQVLYPTLETFGLAELSQSIKDKGVNLFLVNGEYLMNIVRNTPDHIILEEFSYDHGDQIHIFKDGYQITAVSDSEITVETSDGKVTLSYLVKGLIQ